MTKTRPIGEAQEHQAADGQVGQRAVGEVAHTDEEGHDGDDEEHHAREVEALGRDVAVERWHQAPDADHGHDR